MSKPQPKRETALRVVNPSTRFIEFCASSDAVQEFAEFGYVGTLGGNRYYITVDARYDFEEIANYIRDYDAATIPDAFKDA